MPRRRFRVLCPALAAAALLVLGTRGHGQTASTRTVLDLFAPRAIDRGISRVMSEAPDSPERLRRQSIRPLASVVDRIGASGSRYAPGKVIVKFRGDTSPSSQASALASVSRTARVSTRPSYADFDLVAIDQGEDAEAVAQSLAQRPDVEYAQAAYRVHAAMVPNDPYYHYQWNLPVIDMERAWDIQPSAGSNITVAVLDTGMAYTNVTLQFQANAFKVTSDGDIVPPGTPVSGTVYPALGPLRLACVAATELAAPGRFVAPYDFIWNDNLPIDLDGHGTHVSGTVGQITNNLAGTAGVAFNVKLMPVKVLAGAWDVIFGGASAEGGTDDQVARGIRYAADNGAKIINMSLNQTGPAGSAPVIEAAVKYAVGKGVFITVAAGNEFQDGNPTEVLSELASRVQGMVAVAAIDRGKNRALYSSTGSWIELAAPGGSFGAYGPEGGILQQTLDLDLVDTFDLPPSQFTAPRFDALAYFFEAGTSMASPHVAGVAAMLMQQGITDPAALEAALERFATDLGSPGRDDEFGFGLVSARNTLRGLGLAK